MAYGLVAVCLCTIDLRPLFLRSNERNYVAQHRFDTSVVTSLMLAASVLSTSLHAHATSRSCPLSLTSPRSPEFTPGGFSRLVACCLALGLSQSALCTTLAQSGLHRVPSGALHASGAAWALVGCLERALMLLVTLCPA